MCEQGNAPGRAPSASPLAACLIVSAVAPRERKKGGFSSMGQQELRCGQVSLTALQALQDPRDTTRAEVVERHHRRDVQDRDGARELLRTAAAASRSPSSSTRCLTASKPITPRYQGLRGWRLDRRHDRLLEAGNRLAAAPDVFTASWPCRNAGSSRRRTFAWISGGNRQPAKRASSVMPERVVAFVRLSHDPHQCSARSKTPSPLARMNRKFLASALQY